MLDKFVAGCDEVVVACRAARQLERSEREEDGRTVDDTRVVVRRVRGVVDRTVRQQTLEIGLPELSRRVREDLRKPSR